MSVRMTVSKNGETVGTFYGSTEAAQAIGVSPRSILNWLHGYNKSRDGYVVEVAADGN